MKIVHCGESHRLVRMNHYTKYWLCMMDRRDGGQFHSELTEKGLKMELTAPLLKNWGGNLN